MNVTFWNLCLSMSLYLDGHIFLRMHSVFVFLFPLCEIRIWFVLPTYFIMIPKNYGRCEREFGIPSIKIYCMRILFLHKCSPIKELCLYWLKANLPVKISFCRIFNIYIISYTFSASFEKYYVHSQGFIQKQKNLQYRTALWRCFIVIDNLYLSF